MIVLFSLIVIYRYSLHIHFISAKETFIAIGESLKARRKHDELEVMHSYMPSDVQTEDPADHDPELRKLLKDSSKTAEEKMAKVIDLTTKLKKHNQNFQFSSNIGFN